VLKTILVALDSSELSHQVMESLVGNLQIQSTSKMILVHVINRRNAEVEIAADRPGTVGVQDEVPYRHLEKQLQSYQIQLPCKSELEIVSGDPAEEIIRLANIYRADLIVIGNRGLTGMKRIIEGSVSSQVVADAPCSVLVIKPQ